MLHNGRGLLYLLTPLLSGVSERLAVLKHELLAFLVRLDVLGVLLADREVAVDLLNDLPWLLKFLVGTRRPTTSHGR